MSALILILPLLFSIFIWFFFLTLKIADFNKAVKKYMTFFCVLSKKISLKGVFGLEITSVKIFATFCLDIVFLLTPLWHKLINGNSVFSAHYFSVYFSILRLDIGIWYCTDRKRARVSIWKRLCIIFLMKEMTWPDLNPQRVQAFDEFEKFYCIIVTKICWDNYWCKTKVMDSARLKKK